jgi:hypothetical protein
MDWIERISVPVEVLDGGGDVARLVKGLRGIGMSESNADHCDQSQQDDPDDHPPSAIQAASEEKANYSRGQVVEISRSPPRRNDLCEGFSRTTLDPRTKKAPAG